MVSAVSFILFLGSNFLLNLLLSYLWSQECRITLVNEAVWIERDYDVYKRKIGAKFQQEACQGIKPGLSHYWHKTYFKLDVNSSCSWVLNRHDSFVVWVKIWTEIQTCELTTSKTAKWNYLENAYSNAAPECLISIQDRSTLANLYSLVRCDKNVWLDKHLLANYKWSCAFKDNLWCVKFFWRYLLNILWELKHVDLLNNNICEAFLGSNTCCNILFKLNKELVEAKIWVFRNKVELLNKWLVNLQKNRENLLILESLRSVSFIALVAHARKWYHINFVVAFRVFEVVLESYFYISA